RWPRDWSSDVCSSDLVQRHLRLGVFGFLLLTALVSSFVDPQFGPDGRGVVEFLGFLVGVIVVLASFKLPPMLAHRRKTGELGHRSEERRVGEEWRSRG